MQHFFGEGLAAYEGMIQGGPYSYGNRVTLADICLMPQLYNAQRWGVKLADLPKIARIKDSLDLIPAFQDAHPDSSPH